MVDNGEALSALKSWANGTLREYEDFNPPEDQDFSTMPIPRPGEPGYDKLLNALDQAEADANNSCGGN